MSGIEALSLVCNIFQLIEIGHECVVLCKTAYTAGSLDDQTLQRARSLAGIVSDAEKRFASSGALSAEERKVQEIASKTLSSAKALEKELVYLNANARRDDFIAAIRTAARHKKRRGRLENLKRVLANNEQQLDTSLMVRLWYVMSGKHMTKGRADPISKAVDASLIRDQEHLKLLSQDLNTIATRIPSAATAMSDVIMAKLAESRQATSVESLRVQTVLEQKIDTSSQAAACQITAQANKWNVEDVFARDSKRLLDSLRYAGMKQRQNHISPPHSRSFEWVFEAESTNLANESAVQVVNASNEVVKSPVKDGLLERPALAWSPIGQWLSGEGAVYWSSGKLGSGISMLMWYLTEHRRTSELLAHWRTGTVVLQHYFWKAGTEYQRSLSGLCCLVLHQMLQRSHVEALQKLLSDRRYCEKDCCTDWSRQELVALILDLLRTYSPPVRIFIDGADEIDDSSQLPLFELLDNLIALKDVKLCFASRREPLFVTRLSRWPSLRLQDLTQGAMRRVAEKEMSEMCVPHKTVAPGSVDMLVNKLVNKAEGVFLWLSLALRELERQMAAGATTQKGLLNTIQMLRPDLSLLYQDMWERLNDDGSTVKAVAADILHYVVAYQKLTISGGFRCFPLTVTSLAFARHPTIHDRLPLMPETARELKSSLPEWVRHCSYEIESRCAGLIQVTRDRQIPQAVSFVHRTAYDFLLERESGQAILQYGEQQHEVQRIVRLMRSFLLEDWSSLDLKHNGLASQGGVHRQSAFLLPLNNLFRRSASLSSDPAATACLLKFMEGLLAVYQQGYFKDCPDLASDLVGCSELYFLVQIQLLPLRPFLDAIMARLDPHRRSEAATMFLRNIYSESFNRPESYSDCMSLTQLLLSFGGDPSSLGAVMPEKHGAYGGFERLESGMTAFCTSVLWSWSVPSSVEIEGGLRNLRPFEALSILNLLWTDQVYLLDSTCIVFDMSDGRLVDKCVLTLYDSVDLHPQPSSDPDRIVVKVNIAFLVDAILSAAEVEPWSIFSTVPEGQELCRSMRAHLADTPTSFELCYALGSTDTNARLTKKYIGGPRSHDFAERLRRRALDFTASDASRAELWQSLGRDFAAVFESDEVTVAMGNMIARLARDGLGFISRHRWIQEVDDRLGRVWQAQDRPENRWCKLVPQHVDGYDGDGLSGA